MTIRVAITGYGRIGRNVLRAFYEENKWPDVKIVAINDTAKPEATVHLTKFDTTHGKFNGDVYWDDGHLVVNGDRIFMCSERDPKKLPWKDLDIDIVLECTGAFYLVSFRNEAYTREKVLRSKQANLVPTGLHIDGDRLSYVTRS